MPVYNGEKYLHTAIKSILDQTFPDFEFLIMNDGSTDRTIQILKSYGTKDRRIKVFQQKNKGIVKSLNTLIGAAQTDLIARMDADDFSYPQRLAAEYEYLQRHSETALVGTLTRIIEKRNSDQWSLHTTFEEDVLNRWYLSLFPTFLPSSVMFRKNAFNQAGGYRDNEYPAEDYGLLIKIKRHGELNTIPQLLTDYCRNPEGISSKNLAMQIKKRDELNLQNLQDIYENNEIPSIETALELLEKYKMTKHQVQHLAKLACLTGCFLAGKKDRVRATEFFKLALKLDGRRIDAASNLFLQKFGKTFLISIDQHPDTRKLFIKTRWFKKKSATSLRPPQ